MTRPGLRVLILIPGDIAGNRGLLFEERGFRAQAPDLETIIISATLVAALCPRTARPYFDRIRLIDAPFVGSARMAEANSLRLCLAAIRKRLRSSDPLFDVMGRTFTAWVALARHGGQGVERLVCAASTTAMTRSAAGLGRSAGHR